MRRPRFLLAALVVVAALLSSCGSDEGSIGAPPAATVNGADISDDLLRGQLEAAASIEAYGPQLLGLTSTVAGEGANTFDSTAAAEALTTLIAFELIDQEVERRGLDIDDAAREQAEQTIAQVLGADPQTGASDPEVGQAALDDLEPAVRTSIVEGLAGASVLSEDIAGEQGVGDVTDEDVRAAFDDNPESFAAEESCVRHILFMPVDPESGAEATPEQTESARSDAEQLLADLEGGADFEELARERSDDTTSGAEGGDLGCNPRDAFIPEFDEAVWSLEVGERSEVVESAAGFHVIEVYDRRTPTFEDVQDQIRTQLEGQAQQDAQSAAQEAFAEIILDADVTVDPRYGTWEYFRFTDLGEEERVGRDEAQSARVVPPAGPTTTTTASTLPFSEQPLELVPEGG